MYEKPIEQNRPATLQMGSGANATYRRGEQRLLVGGPANGETCAGPDSGVPRVVIPTLTGRIDFLAETPATTVETEYVASRVAFGGRVYRTWRLSTDGPEVHAVATVLAIMDTDPVKARRCIDIDACDS